MGLPAAEETGANRMVAVFAGIGLLVGLAWPVAFGKQLGPNVPGNKKAAAASSAAAAAASGAPALSKSERADESEPEEVESAAAPKQLVIVDAGKITTCWHGKEKLEGERCGNLKLDKSVLPMLRKLDSCPSALGLTGDLQVQLDVSFDKKTSIQVRKGRKASAPSSTDEADKASPKPAELPSSTVTGVLACVADYVREVAVERLAHDHDRYLVEYGLRFRANGKAPTVRSAEEAPATESSSEEVATIVHDSAILRDEPRTGKSVGRLVRGTRVKILGSRKDWFEVKMGNRRGWLYRAALGR